MKPARATDNTKLVSLYESTKCQGEDCEEIKSTADKVNAPKQPMVAAKPEDSEESSLAEVNKHPVTKAVAIARKLKARKM